MIKEEKHRILPALDRAHDEALRQGIISDLVAGGFVTATKTGRRNTYAISADAHLKHPAESKLTLAEFVAVFGRV
jgi:hypothetical protein